MTPPRAPPENGAARNVPARVSKPQVQVQDETDHSPAVSASQRRRRVSQGERRRQLYADALAAERRFVEQWCSGGDLIPPPASRRGSP